MSNSTLRLSLPQWQGGMNPDYYLGEHILNAIVPPSNNAPKFRVDVPAPAGSDVSVEHGIDAFQALTAQTSQALDILHRERPDRVITLGGDCSASQAPMSYLNTRYEGTLGLIWLDAHPDVSTPATTSHLHEMVLANLMGHGAPEFAAPKPFQPDHVIIAGLQVDDLRPMDRAVYDLHIPVAPATEVTKDSTLLTNWITENNIQHVAVHFDLDVLSPQDFRSILPAQPYLETFGAAIGTLTLEQVVRLINDVEECADLVGLTIAEHMPWDALNLRKALGQISLFRD